MLKSFLLITFVDDIKYPFYASVIQGIESWISNPIMSVRIAPEVLLKIVKKLRVSLKNPT